MCSENENSNPIDELVTTLLENHIALSVPPSVCDKARRLLLKSTPALPAGGVLPTPSPRAVIVVLGAGASADTAQLPLGRATADLLRQRLDVPRHYVDNELERLSIQYRLEETEFETQLLALSKFAGPRLLDELGAIFGRRFYAAETYELLAHLFKHRFIDCIINFNFDELLDQAIDDEVSRENYWRIVSDGDIPDDIVQMQDIQGHGRFRAPLYVKPHGTASHKSSMRFTRGDYFLLPENMRQLLLECLTRTDVTMIVIGFGMQSEEFNRLIRGPEEEYQHIYPRYQRRSDGAHTRVRSPEIFHSSTGRRGRSQRR